jgi:hypothetical protein
VDVDDHVGLLVVGHLAAQHGRRRAAREGGPKRRDKREEAPSGHCGELRAVKYTPPGELWNSAPALCRPWYLGCGEIRGR